MTPRPAGERRFLSQFASAPDSRAGLARAAVLLARVHCPDADPDRVEGMLQRLATDLRALAPRTAGARERAAALADLLAGRRGLRGDRDTYDDPRNSCLECVLDRRVGIPIALALVWMCVGRRVGWEVDGIGLPGHFLVRVKGRDGETVLADPFHGGGVLTRQDVRALLEALHGRPVRLHRRRFAPMHSRDILLRVLRNLRAGYGRRGDPVRALAVADDMLLLSPGLPEALRDRGLLRLETGRASEAVPDLRAYAESLERGPGLEATLRLLGLLTDGGESRN